MTDIFDIAVYIVTFLFSKVSEEIKSWVFKYPFKVRIKDVSKFKFRKSKEEITGINRAIRHY